MATTNEEDKELRGNIRDLLQQAKHQKHEFASSDATKLKEVLEKANEYHAQVSKPREQAMDSEVFALVTESGVQYVKRLGTGAKSYTPGDFIRRIKARHSYDTASSREPDVNWYQLGEHVAEYFSAVPVTSHMLGPLDAVPKRRKVAQRQKRREPLGEAVRPDEIEDLGEAEKQETDKNMEDMWLRLKQHGGKANVLQLILNHQSFSQTVENQFSLSFLVRDGRVEFQPCDNGIMAVQRTAAMAKAERSNKQELERTQFLVSLDNETWEYWKELVPENQCIMPHRATRHHEGDEVGTIRAV